MWPIMPSSFPPTPRVKTRGLNVSKTSCDSSTHFAYFNSWQKWMGKYLLWSLDIIQEPIWKVSQNFRVFGVHWPLHIPHFVLLKPIHLTPYPWKTLDIGSGFVCGTLRIEQLWSKIMGSEESVGREVVCLNKFDYDMILPTNNLGFIYGLGGAFISKFDNILKMNIAIYCRKW